MTQNPNSLNGKVAFITGAAHRIGARIACRLHAEGMDLALHFRHSTAAAKSLKDELEASRPDSVLLLQEDLHRINRLPNLIGKIERWRKRLDLLVNNASSFYPTPLDHATEDQWDDLVTVNLKAPFFLAPSRTGISASKRRAYSATARDAVTPVERMPDSST